MPVVTHPSFQQPLTDAPVCRYMNLPKFEWILIHGALYFARGDRFDDPYEGQLPDAIMAKIKANKVPGLFEMWRQFGQNSRLSTYLNCWYGSACESDAMWKLYSTDGVGVAILSNFGALVKSFESTSEQVCVGLVKYGDEHLSSRTTMGNEFDYWLWKRQAFEHEREVRAVISLPVSSGGLLVNDERGRRAESWTVLSENDTPNALTVEVDLPTLIQQVVVSPKSPASVVGSVAENLKKSGVDCSVEQSRLYRRSY
jgi:hypothetical protein